VNIKRLFLVLGLSLSMLALVAIVVMLIAPGNVQHESLLVEPIAEGCTVVMVGKDASADSSVMTTHTADCGICDWTWRHVRGPKMGHVQGKLYRC
jgi:hypothetical protein